MITVREDLAKELATQLRLLEKARTKVIDGLTAGQSLDSFTLKWVIMRETLVRLWTNVETALKRMDAANPEAEITLVQLLEGILRKIDDELIDYTPRASTEGFSNWEDLVRHEARKIFRMDVVNMISDARLEAGERLK